MTSRKARTMRLCGAWDDSTYTTHDGTTGGGVADGAPGGAYARVRAVPLQVDNILLAFFLRPGMYAISRCIHACTPGVHL